jgi:hypothetical protein
MPSKTDEPIQHDLLRQFLDHSMDFGENPGLMFQGLVVYFDKREERTIDQLNGDASTKQEDEYDLVTKLAAHIVTFAGGRASDNLNDPEVTHVVVSEDQARLKEIRQQISL